MEGIRGEYNGVGSVLHVVAGLVRIRGSGMENSPDQAADCFDNSPASSQLTRESKVILSVVDAHQVPVDSLTCIPLSGFGVFDVLVLSVNQ